MRHAGEDQAARRLREQRVEGARVLEALRAALARDGDALLDAAERARVEAAMGELQTRLEGSDPAVIQAGIQALERACASYVERRMNASIQSAMAGHRVDDFE
jgi:molecular chaperone HscA